MRIALIHMGFPQKPMPDDRNELYWQERARLEEARLEMAQTIALARRMRDGGRFAPMVICGRNSPLERELAANDLPHLALNGPLGLLRLWRWQGKIPKLYSLVIGQSGLGIGRRLRKMRKPGAFEQVCAFFLKPPTANRVLCKDLAGTAFVICGSEFVAQRLSASLGKCPKLNVADLPMLVCAPGMDLEGYADSLDGPRQAGRFVFGMAQSLEPRSGALLVARAMAAIWQNGDLPPWEVRMFGDGPRFREILEETENLGVSSRLSILSDQNLAEVTRLCDAWLAPGVSSVELPETFGAGFAAGLPVIAAASELHRERMALMAAPNVTLVPENDPQAMAKAMIATAMQGNPGRDSGRNGLDLDRMADCVCGLLEKRLKQGG